MAPRNCILVGPSTELIKQLLVGLVLRSKGEVREGTLEEMIFALGLDFEDQVFLFFRQTRGQGG